jgi:hypothetical protein
MTPVVALQARFTAATRRGPAGESSKALSQIEGTQAGRDLGAALQ